MQKSLEEAQASLKEHKDKLETLEKKSTVSKEVISLKLQSPSHQKIETQKADEASSENNHSKDTCGDVKSTKKEADQAPTEKAKDEEKHQEG